MARVLHPSTEITDKTPSISFYDGENDSDTIEYVLNDEENRIHPKIIQKVIAEFMGTFILLFMGCGSAFIDQKHNITILGIAFAWSITLMAMIYTLGHISGAHFNPAVTVAFAIVGRFPLKQVLFYLLAQLGGASLGCLALRWLFKGNRPTVMLTLPAVDTDDFTVIGWEIMTSFVLMWVICGAASDHRAVKELSGAAIGAALFLDVLISGKITGASMNPARSIGPAIVTNNYSKIWIYIIAPPIGTVIASSLYNFLRVPVEDKKLKLKNKASRVKSSINPAYNPGKPAMELP